MLRVVIIAGVFFLVGYFSGQYKGLGGKECVERGAEWGIAFIVIEIVFLFVGNIPSILGV